MKKLVIAIILFIPFILHSTVYANSGYSKEDTQSKIVIISFLVLGLIVLILALFFMNRSRQRLQMRNSELKGLFDNMQAGFALHEIICDKDGKAVDYKFIDVNPSFEKMTGFLECDIRNKTVKELMPNIEEHWIEQYGKVALTGEPKIYANYSQELGKHFSVNVYSPMKMQFVTIVKDITDQVIGNAKIEIENHFLESILEDTLAGYWDLNIQENTEYLSKSFKRMFGYKEDELENTTDSWKDLIFQEDLIAVEQLYKRHVESHGRVPYYNEIRYHHKDGSTVWVICSGRVIEWGHNNKPIRMVGCHINITDLKKLEKELKEEKTLFETTLHSLGDGVISTDKNGNIDIMNAIAEKLTGWSNLEAKGLPFDEIFHIINEFTRTKCESPVMMVLKTGESYELESNTLLVKKNGQELPIEDSAAPIKDEKGNINGVVIVFRDFTEKKERQEEIIYLSYHDQLTGLYNRRFFEDELKRLENDRNLPLTIAMVDVNGLKLTNDAFGHLVGDELLKRVAEVLIEQCGPNGIISRIGGDEFIILLTRTVSAEVDRIIKRIYKAISEELINDINISVSIGWETMLSMDQSVVDIFIKAEENMYRKKLTESQSMRNQTIQVILKTLNEKNEREKIHSEKVSLISRKIGQVMNLDPELIKEIEIAGLMHDIGKISISEIILNKPGKLTDLEYDEIKRHTESSYQILKSVDVYSSLADCVLSHHERWDGKGYPRGLKGEDIPLIARIITIADSYEAMTADRPYKKALTKAEAIVELKKYAGTQFDPGIVKICEDNHWTME